MEEKHLFVDANGEFDTKKFYWLVNNLRLTAMDLSAIPASISEDDENKICMDYADVAKLIFSVQEYVCMLQHESETIREAMEDSNNLWEFIDKHGLESDFEKFRQEKFEKFFQSR